MPVTVMAENLTHSYGARTALARISFQAREGEILGILGPNGSGKSTLFRILSTVMLPTVGRVLVAGYDVCKQPAQVRRHIGVVFQPLSLDKQLTVAENLRCQDRLYGLSSAGLRQGIDNVLSQFALTSQQNERVSNLSGGQQRQVDVAKALLHAPVVLLMDEPSTGLDAGARLDLWQHIVELRRTRQVTVLLTTHILDEAERCDRLLLLHEGKIVVQGTPGELKSRIGGDVLVLEVNDLADMQQRVERRFGFKARIVQNKLHVEVTNGHRFIRDVVEGFPGMIHSVSLHKPSLEDVFVHETGLSIYEDTNMVTSRLNQRLLSS
jgi:ABC-2 type transport system ATP-binding protein